MDLCVLSLPILGDISTTTGNADFPTVLIMPEI